MSRAALALDVDGTLDVADPKEVGRMLREAKRLGVPTFINTARSKVYCDHPDPLTTKIARRSRHHCLVNSDPPTSKVINMKRIQKSARVRDPNCVILVDDRPENITAIRRAGFSGVKVKDTDGIRRTSADSVIEQLRRCAASRSPRMRGIAPVRRSRLRLTLIIIAAILLVLIALL